MVDTTAERATEVGVGEGETTHGRKGKEEMTGELRGSVHVASVSVVPTPSTKRNVVRAGEGGTMAGVWVADGGILVRKSA